MKFDHIAIWTNNPEMLKMFYIKYFDMDAGPRYENAKKHFVSYFLSFRESGTRLELMHIPDLQQRKRSRSNLCGIAHVAISVGSRETVDFLTARLKDDGFVIKSEPRITGDGYYESVIYDPEGNEIEITE